MASEHHLWTFVVTGTGTFTLGVTGNPSLVHAGGMSASHLMLTEEQAEQVETTINTRGFTVERRLMDPQTEEQRTERLAIRGSADTVFPCAACPQCYWFDPLVFGLCGRASWPESAVLASLEAHAVAREHEAACPVHPWRTDEPANSAG